MQQSCFSWLRAPLPRHLRPVISKMVRSRPAQHNIGSAFRLVGNPAKTRKLNGEQRKHGWDAVVGVGRPTGKLSMLYLGDASGGCRFTFQHYCQCGWSHRTSACSCSTHMNSLCISLMALCRKLISFFLPLTLLFAPLCGSLAGSLSFVHRASG